MTYEEQLLTRAWKEKRLEIIARDQGMCQRCMRTKNLEVHHKRYIPGRMAWEYDGWDSHLLITLCDRCHGEEHGYDWVKQLQPVPRDFSEGFRINEKPAKHIKEVVIELLYG